MKGVPIKFKGVDERGIVQIFELEEPITINGVTLKNGSLRQLCGYDSDGKEVYENDFLTAERNGIKYYGFATLDNAIDDYGYDLMFERLKMPCPDSYLGDDDFHWRLSKEDLEEVLSKNV